MITQLATTDLFAKLRVALSMKFPDSKVDEILDHYSILKKAACLDQYETCLVNGGKFVEAVLKCLHYLQTGREVDSLKVDEIVKQLESSSKLNDFERLTIPRILRAIYECRNKRGGAHNSSFDPTKMDCAFVVAASNWIMEELVRLYLTNDSVAAQTLVERLLVKNLPMIEEIDGDYLILEYDLPARIQLELILYHRYPKRCMVKDLICWVHNHPTNNIRTSLQNMKQKNLIHENESGWKLTESGVCEAEAEIAKLQADKKRKETISGKMKGVKHGSR